MGKPVIFAATRPYGRAENLTALYEAYDGEKVFLEVGGYRKHPEIQSGKHDLMVIDEFPVETPGKCILIWHSIMGGKTIGNDQPNKYYYPWMKDLISTIVTSGTGTVWMSAQATGLPQEQVLPLGMPRTDVYVGKKKGDGGTILAEKRSYLFAPTFRKYPEPNSFDVDFDWLDEQLTDNELIAVKVHTNSGRMLRKEYKHIIEIPNTEPSTPYLMDCDVVITDYSTIIFDGFLLKKPSVLLEKFTGYVGYRGMYLDYPKQYTKRYCTNEKDLLYLMRTANELDEVEKECIKTVADVCDGHSCERIIKLIHEMNGDEINV